MTGRLSAKQRLDTAVLERSLAETRARAQALIVGAGVTVDGHIVTRPGTQVDADNRIALVHEAMPFVSRGGLKLRHALDSFDVEVAGSIAVDIGSSTGGFTDVLLQAGATCVYSIDVGYGQLAWKLRTDPRVIVMERTNIRYVENLPELASVAAIDVSFISLRLVLPVVHRLLTTDGDCICLVKPQFEAGRGKVGRKGVVRDPAVWHEVLHRILAIAQQDSWSFRGLERSPITGPAGNVEFLIHLSLDASAPAIAAAEAIDRVVGGE